MIKAGIIGSTGYAGQELVRLLMQHPDVEIVWYGSRSYIDQQYADVFQNMFQIVDAKCMDDNMDALADAADVIFTATPQGLCASLVNEDVLNKVKIIDLSADFRIKDVEVYEKWYGIKHKSPSYIKEAVYGLCEINREDIKGARLWKGAKYATENNLPNVAFLRTRIEFIEAFFAPGEISEIWLTFSDPQMKSENSRLTSPMFLDRYRKFLKKGGIVHLKTDSTFLYEYTKAVCAANNLHILASTSDLYGVGRSEGGRDSLYSSEFSSVCGKAAVDALFEVQTFYEQNFLSQGFSINYMAFCIDHDGPFVYPEFDAAYWRAEEAPRFLPGSIGSQMAAKSEK